MKNAVEVHGPAAPHVPLLLDSPHSGFDFPADFNAAVSEFDLRDGEDCFVDELYRPATAFIEWQLMWKLAPKRSCVAAIHCCSVRW